MKKVYILISGEDCLAFTSTVKMVFFLMFQWKEHYVGFDDIYNLMKRQGATLWDGTDIFYSAVELR